MPAQMIIRLSPDLGSADWLTLDEHQQIDIGPEAGALEDIPNDLEYATVTVLIPSIHVLLMQANVPNTSQSRLRQAIPFSLEDDLSDKIENLHFAINDETTQPPQSVAIVNRDYLQRIVDTLKEVGIRAHEIIPDVLALPFHEGIWHVLVEGQSAIVRTGRLSGFVCDVDSLVMLLELQVQELNHTKPEKLHVLCMGENHLQLPQEISGIPVDVETSEQPAIVYLAKSTIHVPSINLLQDQFKSQRTHSEAKNVWRIAGMLIITVLAVFMLRKITTVTYLNYQSKRLNTQIEKIYFQVFPKAKQVTSPGKRLQQAVNGLGVTQASGRLFSILSNAGTVVRKMKSIKLTALTYRDDQLRVTVTANAFSELDALTKALKETNLTVKQENAASRGDEVTAEYIIGEKSL